MGIIGPITVASLPTAVVINSQPTGGGEDIGIGTNALESMTTHTNTHEVAVGRRALLSLTEGLENTAVGANAGTAITTGNTNTVLGASALFECKTGSGNTAIGGDALRNTLEGTNTAVGYQSAKLNSTGKELVAVGEKALGNNTTGNSNTAIGHNALFTNKEGLGNTAVGKNALAESNSNESVAVGYYALKSATTAAKNTAIGTKAGYEPNGKIAWATVTGGQNVFIGYGTGCGSAGDFVNTVAIGFNALVTGSNAISIGKGAEAGAAGTIAIGTEAKAVAENEVSIGVAASLYNFPGTSKTAAVKIATVYPARVERAINTEFEPSATQSTQVILNVETKAATKTLVKVIVGGVTILEDDADAALLAISKFAFTFIVPAGKKWELKVTEGTVEKYFSSYLAL